MQKKLAFDIGCNRGEYSNALLKYGYEKVIAVDPNPHLYINTPDQVIRIVKACSDKKDNLPFYFCNAHDISTASIGWVTGSRFANQYRWVESIVESTTLDDLVLQFGIPQHIKIDVEGFEEAVIKGMSKKYSDELCFEWAEEFGDSAIKCVEFLNVIGYNQFGFILEDSYLKKPDIYYSITEFKSIFHYDKTRKTNWGMIWAK